MSWTTAPSRPGLASTMSAVPRSGGSRAGSHSRVDGPDAQLGWALGRTAIGLPNDSTSSRLGSVGDSAIARAAPGASGAPAGSALTVGGPLAPAAVVDRVARTLAGWSPALTTMSVPLPASTGHSQREE